jgi:alpha-tubulin suppressor-like RCC1 family protein
MISLRSLRPLLAAALFAAGCGGTSSVVSPTDDTGGASDLGGDVSADATPADVSPADAPVGMDAALDVSTALDVPPLDAGPTRCRDNTDCNNDEFGNRICDTASGRCVACTATNRGSCSAGQYCTAANRCESGCGNDTDCASAPAGDGGTGDAGARGLRCDTTRNTCVACLIDDHCGLGQVCQSGACVAGCNSMRGCPTGQACCGSVCLSVQDDPMRCGTCTNVCAGGNNAAPTCLMGACTRRCLPGYADCDGDSTNGCEVSLEGSANCGACGRACSGSTPLCATTGGMSQCVSGCQSGQTRCGNSCANLQNDATDCGRCGNACPVGANAAASCVMGACQLTCNAGFANCDGDPANGCEVNLNSSAGNCGACGNACASGPNSTAACVMGVCRITCSPGNSDCDNQPSNGCEVATLSSAGNCGTCGRVCPSGTNGAATCANGTCGLSCDPGFGDCDGNPSNGCETALNGTSNCGRCGNACTGGTPVCASTTGASAVCTSGCPSGQQRCGDACVDTATSVNHCGACGTLCPAGNNTRATCAAGRCGTTCAPGFADCDGDASNGCEVNTQISGSHCGSCNNLCRAGQNAVVACVTSQCRTTCNLGFGDCDNLDLNGCEANLLTATAHCGGCNRVCPTAANAVPSCVDGGCTFRCVAGYGDCDGNASNGCETALDTSLNCGACGRACGSGTPLCSTAGMTPVCISGCATNQVRCGNSCVDLQSDPANCGACGTVCATGANATRSCTTGRCSIACASGFADCDNSPSSGCEVNLQTDDANCGACGNACGVGRTCTNGACRDRCASGQTFCAGACVDAQSSNAHCGSCGNACATGQYCLSGVCRAGNVSTIASGNDHVCAIRAGGTVWCWGYNGWGQLGNNTTTSSLVLQQVRGVTNAVEVSASGGSSFARLADGTVVGWGLHYGAGELGDGSMVTQRLTPVSVVGLRNIVDLGGGGWAHSCAAASDGRVWCWGYNAYGQLGDGSTANRVAPGLTAGLSTAVEVCDGYLHSCARLSDGTVRCWGYNGYGELGTGNTSNSLTPVGVVGITTAVEIACGTHHTCARLANGTMVCWGYNAYGQLGDGSTAVRYAPGLVSGITTAVEIGTGEDVWRANQSGSAADRTCARLSNGTIRCWGYNGYGGVGDGTTTNRTSPVTVLGITDAIELDAAGRYHTCARRAGGIISCWGYGGNGQMGDGTSNSRTAPGLVVGFP